MKKIFTIDNRKIAKKIIDFLKREFKKRNKERAIVALSGGIDSATTGFLVKKAGLDLYGVILPYKEKGIEDSEKVAKFLKLPKNRVIILDISRIIDTQTKELQKVMKLDKVDKGNIMARERMIVQYALARRLNGLVVGTENLSEYYLGYFTLYGDQACDIAPIAGLFKTQVYQLAEYLGLPEWILKKKPTAGLWSGQTDEKELGFSYQEADPILYFYFVKKCPKKEIIKKGFNKELVNKVLGRVEATEYKRQTPPKILF